MEMKISYCLERVEQYIPAPLRYFKWQKYGHHKEACRRRQTCVKCGEKDPGHVEEDCLKEIKCANCQQDQTAYARSCAVYKKEKEIIEVKHKRNVSFLEAKRIVESYMGEISYASVARRVDRTNDNKYRILVAKLTQLKANYWPKFQEHVKKVHLVEFYQTPAQQQVGNWEISNLVVQTKTHVGSITLTRTTKSAKSPSTKQPLYKSPICPPKSIKDRLKNLSPIRPDQLQQKSQTPISQTAKIQMNTKVNKERPGSKFKMPSTTKSPIRTKQSNAQGSRKSLQRTYCMESMDSDTDRVVASLNLEEIIKNYNTWNHLTVGKLISSNIF